MSGERQRTTSSQGASPALVRVDAFDDRPLVPTSRDWIDVPKFEDPRFRGLRERSLYAALRVSQKGVLHLPGPLREAALRSVAFNGRVFDRQHSAYAEDYIRTALPEATDDEVQELVREAWRHLMRVALVSEGVERRIVGKRLGDHYDIHACREALDVLESGEGALLVTAHVGYWEASCPPIVAIGFAPGYAIGKPPRNDFAAHEMQRMREAQGMRLIPRYGAMSAVPAAVRTGGAVGILLDQRPRQKPVVAPFFGRPANCDRSAGVLMRRVKAPLVFYGCYGAPGTEPLKDWRFDLRFTSVIRPEEFEGLDPAEIATRVNVELERLILERPREMFWLHGRYKGSPASFPDETDARMGESGASSGPQGRAGGTLSADEPPTP